MNVVLSGPNTFSNAAAPCYRQRKPAMELPQEVARGAHHCSALYRHGTLSAFDLPDSFDYSQFFPLPSTSASTSGLDQNSDAWNLPSSFDGWEGVLVEHSLSAQLSAPNEKQAVVSSVGTYNPLPETTSSAPSLAFEGSSMSELEEWLLMASQVSLPPFDTNYGASSTLLEQPFHRPIPSLAVVSKPSRLNVVTTISDDDTADPTIHRNTLIHPFTTSNEIVLRAHPTPSEADVHYPKHTQSRLSGMPPSSFATTTVSSSTDPPLSDFQLALPDKMPRQQPEKRRCLHDLYTPLWVRGEGVTREGWCSLCSPPSEEGGNWLNLKTSQYLYHMQNTHGVDQRTGEISDPPSQLRVYGQGVDRTDGLCGECNEWITICTSRRRRNFAAWFAHARSCHGKKRRPHGDREGDKSGMSLAFSSQSPGSYSPATPASTTSSAPVLPRLKAARISKDLLHQRSASSSNIVSWTTLPSHRTGSTAGGAVQQIRPLFKRPRHR